MKGPPYHLYEPRGKTLTRRKHANWPSLVTLVFWTLWASNRAYQYFDEIISIGDYVLSGGEIPALVLIDAVCRLLPEVMRNPQSHQEDSFENGLLDHEHYTQPTQWENQEVPLVLKSGHHANIEESRLYNALGKTWLNRPDLLIRRKFSHRELALLMKFVQNHNQIN